MFKTFMVAFFAILFLDSTIAVADMVTAEKWTCERDGVVRVVRLYAPAKGEAPCKVFYFKRDPADPTDAKIEADQNSGLLKPIYYAQNNGNFCVRKLNDFIKDREDHTWNCSKV